MNLIPAPKAPLLLTLGQQKPHITREEAIRMAMETHNPKHRLLIRLLWATGGRISEVVGDGNRGYVGILVSDFGRRIGEYFLHLKRLKRRKEVIDELLLPLDCGLAVEEYIRVMNISKTEKVIQMDRRAAYKAIRAIGMKVLGKPVYPHMFRHGFVYHCVQQLGLHPYLVSAMVGHASIASTAEYYHATNEQMRIERERVAF